ncbi:hypothetical protein GCM10022409_01930 [Hymenobacter glaciei]|uniref:Uncharacterized protein n=1 Tax=Hymenobacter glaciei TaxID=877209 RepID=A0ABP7T6L9_9BACT
MKDREVTRQNALSDADLVADCRQRVGQARLDLTDLQAEGVTAADLDGFDTAITEFEKMPSDEVLEYTRVALRETRDAAHEAGRIALRDVLNPVRRAYGDTSPQLKRFGAARLADASVPDVLGLLADAPTTATPYLTDPKTVQEGFNQARLAALPTAHDALRQAQKNFLDADQTREEGTRARTQAYNALDTRCANLCARGHDHYQARNATKASAYVRDPAPVADGTSESKPAGA